MRAAFYIGGKIVVGDSHLACWEKLSKEEQDSNFESGFYDPASDQFISEAERRFLDQRELYLVRHGHPYTCDDPDPDIDREGEMQVMEAAEILSAQNTQGFCGFTSPLLRCLRTASIIHEMLGIKFIVVPEAMESPNFMKDREVFKLKNRSHLFPQFEWPSSQEWHVLPESPHDFYVRVKEILHQFATRSIVVTHFGFIHLTAKIALCKELFTYEFPPASITYFSRHDYKRLGWTKDAEVLQNRPEVKH